MFVIQNTLWPSHQYFAVFFVLVPRQRRRSLAFCLQLFARLCMFPNNIRSPLLRSLSSLLRFFSTSLSVNYLLDSKSYCWVPRISPFSIRFLDRALSWRLSFAFTSAYLFPGFLLHPYSCTESGVSIPNRTRNGIKRVGQQTYQQSTRPV